MANIKDPALAFAVAALRKNKNVAFADVAAAAKKQRLKLWPITFGRAKLVLGFQSKTKRVEATKAAVKASGLEALQAVLVRAQAGETAIARIRAVLARVS